MFLKAAKVVIIYHLFTTKKSVLEQLGTPSPPNPPWKLRKKAFTAQKKSVFKVTGQSIIHMQDYCVPNLGCEELGETATRAHRSTHRFSGTFGKEKQTLQLSTFIFLWKYQEFFERLILALFFQKITWKNLRCSWIKLLWPSEQ